jgi:polyisoprenoid-binding protein YceI
MRIFLIITCFFIIVFKVDHPLNANEIWLLDKNLSTIEFEVPVFFAKNVKGEFKEIEGFVQLNNQEQVSKVFILVKVDSININYEKHHDLLLSSTFLNQKEFKNIFVDTIQVPISYNKEKINEVKIRISLNGIYEYIPYNFEIIELAEELVQIKGELELSRSFFKIGMGKWYSTTFLKENIMIKTNLFLNKR